MSSNQPFNHLSSVDAFELTYDSTYPVVFHVTICERSSFEEEAEVEEATQQTEMLQKDIGYENDKSVPRSIATIMKKLVNKTKGFKEMKKVNGEQNKQSNNEKLVYSVQ